MKGKAQKTTLAAALTARYNVPHHCNHGEGEKACQNNRTRQQKIVSWQHWKQSMHALLTWNFPIALLTASGSMAPRWRVLLASQKATCTSSLISTPLPSFPRECVLR